MHKKIIIIIAIIIAIILTVYFCAYDRGLLDENNLVENSNLEILNNEITNSIKDNESDEEQDYNSLIQEENVTTDILGTLIIEKIGLNAPIKEGSDSTVLNEYVGHIEETPTYDGNVGLAAHNRGNTYSYFAKLNELIYGDEITYKNNNETRKYKVNNITTILETDWKLLENTTENKLTLITCIKNKPNQRLCVQAIEIK